MFLPAAAKPPIPPPLREEDESLVGKNIETALSFHQIATRNFVAWVIVAENKMDFSATSVWVVWAYDESHISYINL